MERTYILGNSEVLSQIGGTFVEIPSFNVNEEAEIHDWIVRLFEDNEIEKVAIEVDVNPNLSLQIGFHIRLSIEELREKALVPILYLSQLTLNTVIQQTAVNSHIIATKGVMFSEFSVNENRQELELLQGLHENEYLTGFLKRIHIQPDESIGRHSLANIWGAYALDKAANTNALKADAKYKKKLYFKYVSAFNDLNKLKPPGLKIKGQINLGVPNRINAVGRKVLLIDDEADKGWETVLRKTFKTSSDEDFVVITEKVKDYQSFTEASKEIIESESFDLYLVDLRLNGMEEDENLNTVEFSGMKVLEKIKLLNKGNQVIIFSASNKIWNLESLLDAGADGYYLKESPEFKFSPTVSEQKYKEFKVIVDRCLKRGYLRELYTEWKNTLSQNRNSSNVALSNTSLKLAWELLKRDYLDFGFLTLFQIIEGIANDLYSIDDFQDTLGGKITIDKTDKDRYEWFMTYIKDYENGSYFVSRSSQRKNSEKPTTLYKVSSLFKITHQVDDDLLKRIGYLNNKRNKIAHHSSQKVVDVDDLKEVLRLIALIRNK